MGDLYKSGRPGNFEQEIKGIVSRISHIDEAELQDHLLIREELDVDSLMAMEIICACEKHMGIRLDESILVEVRTVGDFLMLLWKLSGQQDGLSYA